MWVALAFVSIMLLPVVGSATPSFAKALDATQSHSISLKPTDDSYVLANISSSNDPFGFRNLNFGNSPVLNVGFQGPPRKAVISLAYLKFHVVGSDGNEIPLNSVSSLVLRLYANSTYLGNMTSWPVLAFATNQTTSAGWKESALNFNNSPHATTVVASENISSSKAYYSWDVTSVSKGPTLSGGNLTLVLGPSLSPRGSEVHFLFNSNEAPTNPPELVVEYAASNGGIVLPLPWYWLAGIGGAAAVAAVGYVWYRRPRDKPIRIRRSTIPIALSG